MSLVPVIAHAGPALDDGQTQPKTDPNTGALLTQADEEPTVEYGVGLRLRNVRIPHGMFGLFTARSAGGMSDVGYGLEFIRRKGNVELQLGLEYEKLDVPAGVWIESGKSVPSNEADVILGPQSNLSWVTLEFTFINHAPINKYVAFRYGGGAGIGIFKGDLKRVDVQCAAGSTNDNVDPGCYPNTGPASVTPSHQTGQATITEGPTDGSGHVYDLPPVFPVVNAIIGVQITPTPQFHINIEGGIRTMPFFGMSASYFF